MNLPSEQELNPMDGILGQRIKRWATRTHPPSDGQARLLWEAATWPQEKRIYRLGLLKHWLTSGREKDGRQLSQQQMIAQTLILSIQINFLSVL
jgi:hypothetical protein